MNPDDVERIPVSKVPEKDKAFHPSSSLKAFDKDATLEKIRTIQIFYDEVSAFAVKITDEGVNCEHLRRKICLLKKTLTQVYEATKREEQETSNNSISNMHKSFIKEHEKLDSIVKDVENAALSEMLTVAHNGWRKAVSEIAALKETLQDYSKNYSEINKKYDDICEKFDKLKREDKKYAEQLARSVLMEQNLNQIMEFLKR